MTNELKSQLSDEDNSTLKEAYCEQNNLHDV